MGSRAIRILVCATVMYILLLFIASVLFNYISSVTTGDSLLTAERQIIAKEMENFQYSKNAVNLLALTPESGGTPYRSVIFTTWRSGSTFLGDILNAMPGNYYYYEPLLHFGTFKVRGPPYAEKAIRDVKQLLNCNYTAMDDYLNHGQKHKHFFTHNTRLWQYCDQYPQHCWNLNFLSSFCKMFPLQTIKFIRLRLSFAHQLITDEHLNVRVLLLVRDPRGTLQSRKLLKWCAGNIDCDDPATLCKDLVENYYAALILSKKYPQKFKAIRYEDLALNPHNMTKEILNFYKLPYDPKVKEFLDSHTRSSDGDIYSTFRDSKSTPFHWITGLGYDELDAIQGSCAEALRLWGYRTVDNTTILDKSFNPLLSFSKF